MRNGTSGREGGFAEGGMEITSEEGRKSVDHLTTEMYTSCDHSSNLVASCISTPARKRRIALYLLGTR